MAQAVAAKGKILTVLFIHDSGYVESHSADEIRAAPEAFKALLAERKAEGRRAIVMRYSERGFAA